MHLRSIHLRPFPRAEPDRLAAGIAQVDVTLRIPTITVAPSPHPHVRQPRAAIKPRSSLNRPHNARNRSRRRQVVPLPTVTLDQPVRKLERFQPVYFMPFTHRHPSVNAAVARTETMRAPRPPEAASRRRSRRLPSLQRRSLCQSPNQPSSLSLPIHSRWPLAAPRHPRLNYRPI